jgi:hypothetical protein
MRARLSALTTKTAWPRVGLIAACLVALPLGIGAAGAAASGSGNSAVLHEAGGSPSSVSQPLGSLLLTTTIEPHGLSYVLRERDDNALLGGLTVDYDADRVTVYDAKKRLVQNLTVAQAEQVSVERQTILARLPFSDANGPLPFATGTMSPLGQTRTIGGVAAEAWKYQLGDASYRVWYPTDAPSLPAADAKGLAQLLPAGGASLAGKVALLAEPYDGKEYAAPKIAPLVTTLTPAAAQQALVLPSGLHSGSLIDLKSVILKRSARQTQSVPANVIRLPVNLLQIHGINPLVAYWGPRLTSSASAPLRALLDSRIGNSFVKAPYVTALSQYGVHPGAMAQPSITFSSAPFFDIGNSPTTPTVVSHALTMASVQLDRFGDPAWTLFNQDSVPVVVMLVSSDEVAAGSVVPGTTVGGYHLAVPARGFAGTLGVAGFVATLLATGPAGLLSTFNPFLPMLIAPVVPFIVAKVPVTGAASTDADKAGPNITHELDETETDPWGPEIGWADPTKTPFLSASEVGDICSDAFLPLSPFATQTRLNGQLVSTYWSNRDHACVPESRPILTVLGPSHDQTLLPGLTIAVSARCTDRVTGFLLPVTWLVNGVPTPESPAGSLPAPAHGVHERVQAQCSSGTALSQSPEVTITGG